MWGKEIFTNLLSVFQASRKPGRHRRPARPARRSPLCVEPLEARELLAAQLQVTPITWNVLGLDSNNVNAGPNTYPVGVRVKNVGDAAATSLAVNLVWDTANANINLTGPSSHSAASLAAGASADFYFNAVITRTSAA